MVKKSNGNGNCNVIDPMTGSHSVLLQFYILFVEYILDEAKVTLEVGNIKGVPMPEEVKVSSLLNDFLNSSCYTFSFEEIVSVHMLGYTLLC